MELDRAKAICNVASQLIDSARVEVKFLEAVDASITPEFFDVDHGVPRLPAAPPFEDLRPRKRNGHA